MFKKAFRKAQEEMWGEKKVQRKKIHGKWNSQARVRLQGAHVDHNRGGRNDERLKNLERIATGGGNVELKNISPENRTKL